MGIKVQKNVAASSAGRNLSVSAWDRRKMTIIKLPIKSVILLQWGCTFSEPGLHIVLLSPAALAVPSLCT